LPDNKPVNTKILFADFAYADLPIGKTFQRIFPIGDVESGVACESKVIAATQENGKSLDGIPYAGKTICLIEFPQGVPEIIKDLLTVDNWAESLKLVCLCSEETWRVLKDTNKSAHNNSSNRTRN
jgi:hypothetical protein